MNSSIQKSSSLTLRVFTAITVSSLFFGSQVLAQSGPVVSEDQLKVLSAFKEVTEVALPSIVVPTVVTVPLGNQTYRTDRLLVVEKETSRFIGSQFISSGEVVDPISSANTVPATANSSLLVDNNRNTTVDFPVTGDKASSVRMILSGNGQTITATTLDLDFAPHVSLPLTVAVKAGAAGNLQTVVTQKKFTGTTIRFPETSASVWEIELTHVQPLRIAEINLYPDRQSSVLKNELRFLAQPNRTYQVYSNADRVVDAGRLESGNLSDDEGVVPVQILSKGNNPLYTPADVDDDGVQDTFDNCVSVANTNQLDQDGNGKGDDCEDFDRDGRMNPVDNCPNTPNRNQADEDGDGIGDLCDDEESRVTERHTWVPWVGMGIAALVVISLFVVVGHRQEPDIEMHSEE